MADSKFIRYLYIVSILSAIFIVVSRAPEMISNFSVLGLNLKINAGYIVVFSIPISFALMVMCWVFRDKTVLLKQPYDKNKWIIYVLILFPVFASFFMFIQYMTEFSPPLDCNTFSRLRFFWDFSLMGIQPEYCFGLSKEEQELMPYIYPPLQTWGYISFLVAQLFLSIKLIKFLRAK